MKVKIESIEISGEKLKAILQVETEFERMGGNYGSLTSTIENAVARQLVDKIMAERGPAILEAITNNQLINATIMRVAGSLTGDDRR